jgi:hypothetical protein
METKMGAPIRDLPFRVCEGALLCALFNSPAGAKAQATPLPAGVGKLCAIQFDRDLRRPARVEDAALPCLKEAARRMRAETTVKLVLVGLKDPSKDHDASENGKMRETEDTTGYDIRLEDLAAYRSLNAKGYLVRWYHIDPARILPTTDESQMGQSVTFYLVPGDADFNHNYLGTTKTNERPCTVRPCYPADEESLAAQPRSRIFTTGKGKSGK